MIASYAALEKLFEKMSHLQHLRAMASWDQAVNMPKGAVEARGAALAEVSVMLHELTTSHELKEALHAADETQETLSPWQRANLREAKRLYKLATESDGELVKKRSELEVSCEYAWREARHKNDWKGFLPAFKELLSIIRAEAKQKAAIKKISPYNALLNISEPGLTAEKVNQLFKPLKAFLIENLPSIVSRQKEKTLPNFDGSYSIESQKNLGLTLMRQLGFNFDHGRLDVSTHPFCGGVPQDVRITTRYSDQTFTSGLMGVIHETGHALYEQNLPTDYIHQPVGSARGMAVHESQSLFMEMQIARSKPFLTFLTPLLLQTFPTLKSHPHVNPDDFYRYFTQVRPGKIRVDADEVTYPFHIILRHEIEEPLINGDIEAEDIPALWNEKMKHYLGIDLKGDDQNGCLQDIHWPSGAFGYFPSYTLGAMIAAQLKQTLIKNNPNFERNIEAGDFSNLREWLKKNIWSQASFYENFDDLCTAATGEPLDAKYFIQHISLRYIS